MTSPTGTIRPIHYPLNRSEDLESVTPNTPPIENLTLDGWVSNDPDERVPIVLDISLNEYVALATCVDVGRDIAFGDNSIYLWWVWVRSLLGMDLCDLILECMLTNQDIQEAIANYSGGSNINNTTVENATNLATGIVDNPPNCNDDIIYGMTTQLVEFADRLCKDLFEQIDASQLASVNVGYILKLIPVVETLPIDELFELTDKLVDDLETGYLSASTQLLKTEIACDLFCIAKDNNCQLTLEDVRDYFEVKSGVVFTYTDVGTFILDFINGTFIGNAIYYGMNTLLFQIFAFGGKFLEYLFEDYLRVISSMYNDPNPDWLTDCDPCVSTWTHTFDFTVNDGGWTGRVPGIGVTGTYANYIAGVGWSYGDATFSSGDHRRCVSIEVSFADTALTEVELTWTVENKNVSTALNGVTGKVITVKDNTVNKASITDVASNVVNGVDQVMTLTMNPSESVDLITCFQISSAIVGATWAGNVVITKVVVSGEGTNPF